MPYARSARCLAALLFAWPLVARSDGGENTRPPAEGATSHTLRVAAVQMRSTRDLSANVVRIREHLRRCAREGVRVAVFPECALTGYFAEAITQRTATELAEAERQVGEACRESNLYAIVGTPYRDGDRLLNSAVVFHPSGRVIERYHKIQLAEAWPTPG
ncbi:MAG: carbon-nitrogen hydrolase family protein, partial [Isosphaeraceae bacterium]|nr:carbon-nitrogen hydrolase family protein [Isosphaeraceae bacterium]